MDYNDPTKLPSLPLPPGVTSRYVDTSPNSLVFHILESGATPDNSRPLILLIHGFPELAFSWRYILPLLGKAGYHAVAFDQRGFGRTHPSDGALPPSSFRPLNLIKDVVVLVHALGYKSVCCIVGHDFGGVTASLCALSRPDLFRSCVLMSHPFKGAATLPFKTANGSPPPTPPVDMEAALASLNPPRKHYKWYYCTPSANEEMTHPTSDLPTFLRGYFHLKSGDWPGNSPFPLSGWTATELAKMPHYYIMRRDETMREVIAHDMTSEERSRLAELLAARSTNPHWLPDAALDVYASEYRRTTFAGGLAWYKVQTSPEVARDIELWSGAQLSVPTAYVAGERDWGTYQEPGAVEAMQSGKSVKPECWLGITLVKGAGHWVNQEKPDEVVAIVLRVAEKAKSN